MSNKPQQHDIGFYTIAALVFAVVLWLLLTPVLSSVSFATMRRFHLGSSSFPRWAAQFPIPAMYNFANRYELSDLPPDLPPGLIDPLVDTKRSGYLNHFSSRVVTFADGRYRNLHEGKHCWVTLVTDYRGRSIETRWHLQPAESGYVLKRLDAREFDASDIDAQEVDAQEVDAQEVDAQEVDATEYGQ